MPYLENKELYEINESDIQTIVRGWENGDGKQKKMLNRRTVQNLLVLLKQFMRYSLKKGWTSIGEFEIHLSRPRIAPRHMIFDFLEQRKIIEATISNLNDKNFGILLALNSGLRIGELCALKWGDINMEEGIIHVNKTLQRIQRQENNVKSQIIITSPKTETSIRDIPLSDQLQKIIIKLSSYNSEHYVLTSSVNPMEPKAYRNYYKKFIVENKLPNLSFHSLRHTFATCCIEKGADYKCVSELLGHSSISTTMNMYVHPLMETKRKCVELIMVDKTLLT